jgi:hypothetical protein
VTGPPVHAPGEQAFSYLGVVKGILGVFIGLSAVEVPIFDLIVRHVVPWQPARWIVLGLGLWGLPVPKGMSEPADELRLYADDPDGLVRVCREVAGAERAIMRHAQEG